MIDSFEDYYKFLEIQPSADEQTIQAAIATAQKKIEEARLFPSLQHWAITAREILSRAIEHLGDLAKRQAYDAQRTQYYEHVRVSVANLGAQILWLDPPYIFYTDDPDPAHTVPALARKLDADWKHAIDEISDQGLETALRHIGRRSDNPQPYEQLRHQIGRLRHTLGNADSRKRQLLESVIILCDETIQRPRAQIGGQEPGDFTLKPVARRPDQPASITFQLEHGGPRGVLFGYLWLEETWGQITAPPLENLIVHGERKRVARFELAGSEKVDVTVTIQSAQLMERSRPGRHSLTLRLLLQPDTAHETQHQIMLALDIIPIPAKIQCTPSIIMLPRVRRGQYASGVSVLMNQGEQPLNARCSGVSDQSVTVTPAVLPTGGQVQVTVDTRGMREGSRYQKWVKFQADGDIPEVMLQVNGELMPTAFQHFFRQRSAEKRLQSAFWFGLLCIGLNLFTFLANTGWLFWLFWIVIIFLLTTGVAALASKQIVKHIQAVGDTAITQAPASWNRISLSVGSAATMFALIIAFMSLDAGTTWLLFLPLFALVGACWGFFYEEDKTTKRN